MTIWYHDGITPQAIARSPWVFSHTTVGAGAPSSEPYSRFEGGQQGYIAPIAELVKRATIGIRDALRSRFIENW
jgi:hypothetical protein